MVQPRKSKSIKAAKTGPGLWLPFDHSSHTWMKIGLVVVFNLRSVGVP